MAKKVYLTQEQINKLKQNIVEEQQPLTMPLDVKPGENVVDVANKAKENLEQATNTQVANDANFTIKGLDLNGKVYKKKQIEESRVQKLIKNGKKYTKFDFAKTILKNE